jgi:hypothetical protein
MTTTKDDRRSSDRLDVSSAGVGRRFGHFHRPMVRVAAFILALGTFLYAANVIDPGQSAAVSEPEAEPSRVHAGQTPPVSIGRLGALTSLNYTVEIHATIEGPRYTVRDAGGVILGALLEAAEVEQVAPGLELEDMISSPMMLAEPRDDYHR